MRETVDNVDQKDEDEGTCNDCDDEGEAQAGDCDCEDDKTGDGTGDEDESSVGEADEDGPVEGDISKTVRRRGEAVVLKSFGHIDWAFVVGRCACEYMCIINGLYKNFVLRISCCGSAET